MLSLTTRRLPARIFGAASILMLASCGGSGSASSPTPPTATTYALHFDGVQQFARSTLVGPPSLPVVTVEAWVRPDALTGPSSYGGMVVADGAWNLALTHNSPGRVATSVCVPGCNGAFTGANALSVGTWHHLAMSFDGASIELYLDGVLVDSTPHTGGANNPPFIDIGRWANSGSFTGEIDEVRIWSVARTATEIADTRHQILTGSEPGLFAYWRFEEGTGQTSADSTGNGNTVILGADANAAADDPTWAGGGAPVS